LNNAEVRYEFMQYFARDYACHADDFLAASNKVVLAREPSDPFVSMRCFGHATVAKAQPQLYDWCVAFAAKHPVGFRIFDGLRFGEVAKELAKHGHYISSGQGALPDMSAKRTAFDTGFRTRVFEHGEMGSLCGQIDPAEWPMCEPSEKNAIAVAAYDGDKVVAMSVADDDTGRLYSIGIEVQPAYRGRGLAVALTNELTNLLLNRGVIPFATFSWANIASKTTLYKCGYFPAWTSMESTDGAWAKRIISGQQHD